jgi:hypothetical protein
MTKKSAYDKRRYLTLVAVLAQDDEYARDTGLHAIMKYWGLKWKSEYELHPERLISALAQHAVLYHRSAACKDAFENEDNESEETA